MPIKAENLARYPKDWPQIRARIQQRAGNKCEQCGVPNGKLGGRLRDGTFLPAIPDEHMLRLRWPDPGAWSACGDGTRFERLRIIRIVCTTAHLDHTPENCADDNLRFWCQRCHLAYDHAHHQRNARDTRRKGLAVSDLFPDNP
jgi:5-methylcytosine-specific restriction endonuclease McrA